jgi:hypothetical protein
MPANQHTAEDISPNQSTLQFVERLKTGSTKTDAKNTCPMSRKISAMISGFANLSINLSML